MDQDGSAFWPEKLDGGAAASFSTYAAAALDSGVADSMNQKVA
ncbi:hypothetical protein [Arthrobacter citreus]